MLETIEKLRKGFWNEDVWTPPNATWKMYETNGYRHFNDLYYSAYTAVILIIIRIIFNRFLFIPLGIWLGLPPTRPRPPPANKILEQTYHQTRGKLSDKQLSGLCKQLDCNERKIQRWMRLRSTQSKPTILSKFTESAWRCLFYCTMFTYGLVVLWDKPWMWDSAWCFIDYPHHFVSSEEWWYYNIESAFYLALLFSQFVDVQRKDFWVMFVHHVVTLCLLSFSWACNLIRIGTLVLVIHDFADIPLEGAKMMAYVKKQQIADVVFNVFALCWIISRIGLLPYRIIYYSSYVAVGLVPMFSAYYIFNSLLIALQILHIIWTYFIIRVAIQAWNNNGIKDIRSDDEDEEDFIEEDEEEEDEDEEIVADNDELMFNNDSLKLKNNGNTHFKSLNNDFHDHDHDHHHQTKIHSNGLLKHG
ncbi:ceramide synthase 6 [Dermatophagoides farinae]|uniref:ceramide synthase 6 n=1 Tax=Dermatophagoides farinae TaxID=6954 RepID=UPI003F624D55